MQMTAFNLTVKQASAGEIRDHLVRCDDSFVPPLSSRVDLAEYSLKLSKMAVTFEAFDGGELVGLVAAYFTKENHNEAYITNVSVIGSYEGTGLAIKLMTLCMEYAKEKKFTSIVLEVSVLNKRAIRFYEKLGFILEPEHNGQVNMRFLISE